MPPDNARKQAFALLATYDRPEATPDELHIVRISKTWISIMRARQSVQGIVNRIMERFGGGMDIESEVGTGTKVTVFLPIPSGLGTRKEESEATDAAGLHSAR